MANGSSFPAELLDADGNPVLPQVAAVQFTDASDAPDGGGGSIPSGAGSPAGSVTPAGIGALYIDSTNGALWIAIGATSADWIIVGGVAANHNPKQGVYTLGAINLVAAINADAVITDALAAAGSGNGIYWRTNSAPDGGQEMVVFVGAGGAFTVSVLANGVLDTSSGAGVKFPTADPHVAGAWWDNGVTLMRSAG